ncbi:hypothetical protein ACLOJK_024224 [Asimina triloba]
MQMAATTTMDSSMQPKGGNDHQISNRQQRRMQWQGQIGCNDNSYGWFNPAKLIPFDSHYVKKSRLATSRDFKNAVDEAVDEVRRRSSHLGLLAVTQTAAEDVGNMDSFLVKVASTYHTTLNPAVKTHL